MGLIEKFGNQNKDNVQNLNFVPINIDNRLYDWCKARVNESQVIRNAWILIIFPKLTSVHMTWNWLIQWYNWNQIKGESWNVNLHHINWFRGAIGTK